MAARKIKLKKREVVLTTGTPSRPTIKEIAAATANKTPRSMMVNLDLILQSNGLMKVGLSLPGVKIASKPMAFDTAKAQMKKISQDNRGLKAIITPPDIFIIADRHLESIERIQTLKGIVKVDKRLGDNSPQDDPPQDEE